MKAKSASYSTNLHLNVKRPSVIGFPDSYVRTIISCLIVFISVFNGNKTFSQQPGGVSGTKLWYVTSIDSPNTLVDRSGNNGREITSGLASNNFRNINFYSGVLFQGTERVIKIENFKANHITGVGIFYPGAANSSTPIFFAMQGAQKNETAYSKVTEKGVKKYDFGNDLLRTSFKYNTAQTNVSNAMKTGVFSFPWRKANNGLWNENLDVEIGTSFKGYIPELIVYTRKLSKAEINKIQSYLSIKYGTTLDTSYTNSVGRTIWNVNDERLRPFHNRLIAVGKDSLSGLFQVKSNSTYEDNGDYAYSHHANASVVASQAKFIPAKDKPSSYRSVTIELSGKDPIRFPDKNFLFFGDDGRKVIQLKKLAKTEFSDESKKKYPNLDIVAERTWLAYNQDLLKDSVKMVVSGINFTEKRLFNTLYKAWDYQLYRVVLVRFDGNEIESLVLNSNFGREHFSDNRFNTRTLVWDNLTWVQHSSKYHHFTFGRVPVLNFLQIGKSGKPMTSLDHYPYERENPISNVIRFDTLKNNISFKLLEDKEIEFTVSPGVPPLTVNLFLVENGKLEKEIMDPLKIGNINEGSINESQVEADDQNSGVEYEDGDINPLMTGTLVSLSRHIPISTQLKWDHWPVKFVIKSNKIEINKTYLIRVSDSLGQITTLPFRTKSSN
ncbi:hypothetical protein [Dyadobacter fermentans]|uniref:hypothetical protein n=1 Tax=Dyadobacter fermentans TaxID=94254 RepID=UPI001CBF5E1A|nr:hypothetical protein [Dyadobacter fermentans]MBZ1362749.1 hypothetical protein [Dyadobacter fermentans]